METWVVILVMVIAAILLFVLLFGARISKLKKAKKYERGLKMVPLLIHLPPSTDDIDGGGRDKRDITNEAISKAQVMYSILSSTLKKGRDAKLYGQRHFSFEIIAKDGLIKYFTSIVVLSKNNILCSLLETGMFLSTMIGTSIPSGDS